MTDLALSLPSERRLAKSDTRTKPLPDSEIYYNPAVLTGWAARNRITRFFGAILAFPWHVWDHLLILHDERMVRLQHKLGHNPARPPPPLIAPPIRNHPPRASLP